MGELVGIEGIVEKLHGYALTYGMSTIAALLIVLIGRILARFLSRTVEKILLKSKVEQTLAVFVKHITYVALMAFVILAALGKLGVQTTSFIAVLGAAGLAVGLALQGSLSNFAAGVMLILFKPFKVGDYIDAGGATGTVEEIQIFNTIVTTPDNKRVIIPNSKITGDNITNFTAVEKRRVDLVFGISYDDDMRVAKTVLLDLVKSDERVLTDPEPVVAVSELADSSVNLVCRPWVKPEDYWSVFFDFLEKGKIALEEKGLSIPYPQSDVHIHNENA